MHWYTTDAQPCHQVKRAKGGGMRDTTLRDARKLNLLPSVTTVLKQTLAAPGLERWIQNQLLDTAYAMPPVGDELPDDWKRSVFKKSEESGAKRMDFGTLVHDALERTLKGEDIEMVDVTTPIGEQHNLAEFVNPVVELFRDNRWECHGLEDVLVGKGYAGTADVIYTGVGEYGIIDFKTTKDATKPFIPPTYPAQIALYHVAEHGGIDDHAVGYNIFISTERNVGSVKVVSYDAERLRKEYAFGLGIIGIWQHLNNYTPKQ